MKFWFRIAIIDVLENLNRSLTNGEDFRYLKFSRMRKGLFRPQR